MKEYHSNATLALQSAGVKPSPQRVAILQWLMDNRCHPTVDEIYRALEQIYPTLSRTTVYNTMWLLAEAGVIRAITIDRTTTRFDYSTHDHAHFRCRRCGCIVDVPMVEVQRSLPAGYKAERTEVYFEGLCPNCTNLS
jgi:Fe2+ or Zn2+ uptake regulation protein